LIPAIKESSYFKQFIGIDEHFPEFCNEFGSNENGLNPSSLLDRPSVNGFSFKIMNDLLGNNHTTNASDSSKQ
jgi:hypothetical protein